MISQNSEPDFVPSLLGDGRVIYSRWEYTDKSVFRVQSLWTTNPDGTGTMAFWGNQSVWPDHLAEPRQIPGSRRVMFSACGHHDWFSGCIGIIDPRRGFNFPDGLTKVTWDLPWPEVGRPPVDPHESEDYHASGLYTSYKTPYPLSEEDFLVSARGEGDKFRLYLMDVHGNRELIYEGTAQRLACHPDPAASRSATAAGPRRLARHGRGTHAAGTGDPLQCRRLPGAARFAARQREVPAGRPIGRQDLFDLVQDLSSFRPAGLDRVRGVGEAHPEHGAGRGRRFGVLPSSRGPGPALPAAGRAAPLPADDAEFHGRHAGRAPRLRRLPRVAQHGSAVNGGPGLSPPAHRADAAALGHREHRLRAVRPAGARPLLRKVPSGRRRGAARSST